MIGIVSYLPDDENLKTIRKKNHKNQLDWLFSLFNKEKIYIVSQNYKDNDYINDKRIEYIKFDKPIGIANAKNEIFKLFYKSNDDVLFIMDDDVYMYDYYDVTPLLINFYKNFSSYIKYNIDMIVPLMPNLEPFKQFIYEKTDYRNYYCFKKANINCCPNLMMIKNLKKYNDVELYMVQYDKDSDDAISEDLRFMSEFIFKGFKPYKFVNWIKKSPDRDTSVIFETTDTETTRRLHNLLINNLKDFLNNQYKLSGGVAEFNKKYNKAENFIYIKRDTVYDLPDNLKPVYKTKSNLLF